MRAVAVLLLLALLGPAARADEPDEASRIEARIEELASAPHSPAYAVAIAGSVTTVVAAVLLIAGEPGDDASGATTFVLPALGILGFVTTIVAMAALGGEEAARDAEIERLQEELLDGPANPPASR